MTEFEGREYANLTLRPRVSPARSRKLSCHHKRHHPKACGTIIICISKQALNEHLFGAYVQAITPKLMKRRVLFNGKKLRDVPDAILVSCMTQTHVQQFTGHEDILS